MGVRLLDATQSILERLPDILGDFARVPPVTAIRHLETVVFWKQGGFLVTIELLHRRIVFLIMHVRDALEEQEREDVGLEIGGIDRAA